MPRQTEAIVKNVEIYLIPVTTRIPLKFGAETLNQVTCARSKVTIEDRAGNRAVGWGETPLSVQWSWPSQCSYSDRYRLMIEFCSIIKSAWLQFGQFGHPMEVGYDFQNDRLQSELTRFNDSTVTPELGEAMPYLASLVCASTVDQAVHDAYGNLHQIDVYKTYNDQFMSRDLTDFLEPFDESKRTFENKYPEHFFATVPPKTLPVWHLVGGLDPVSESELTGNEPNDGYPVLLSDWIRQDGLKCLKLKLRGNDRDWDIERVLQVGRIAEQHHVKWLSADFNCTVRDPEYVIDVLAQIESTAPQTLAKILYVEQPFPYDLEKYSIDVRSISERKPLFLDESAHDWRHVRHGLELGWTGVALKTCKTQTGALLSLCWAKAHGMPLMVQDLTNPMLAQIPHVRLAAHADTIMGVESNGMQFYPDASDAEARIHPGLFQRRNGSLDLSTIRGGGFGYRIEEIARPLNDYQLVD